MLRTHSKDYHFGKLKSLIILPSNNFNHPALDNLNAQYFPPKRIAPLLEAKTKKSSAEEEYIFAVIAISNAYKKAIAFKEKYLPPIEKLINSHSNILQKIHFQKKIQLIKQSINDSPCLCFKRLLSSEINHSIENIEKLFCSFLSKLASYGDAINHLTYLIDCYIANPNHDLIRHTQSWQSRNAYLLRQFFPSIIAKTKYIIDNNYQVKAIPLNTIKTFKLFF